MLPVASLHVQTIPEIVFAALNTPPAVSPLLAAFDCSAYWICRSSRSRPRRISWRTSTVRLAYAAPYVVPYANVLLTYGSHLGLSYAMDR